MLNTRSCLAATLIWLVIVGIAGAVLWDLMGWQAPGVVWAQFLDSKAADVLKQFQTLVAGLVGFGLASFAYWYNGHQDRQVAARETDQQSRTLAHALMLETERLEADCDLAAARFAGLAEEAGKKTGGAVQTLAAANRMLLRRGRTGGLLLAELGTEQLARLGTNACSALLMLRNAVADLDREAAELSGDGANPTATELKDIARAFSAVCLKCARVRPLLWTLARHGPDVADERDPAAVPSLAEVDSHVKALAARTETVAGNVINAGARVAAAH